MQGKALPGCKGSALAPSLPLVNAYGAPPLDPAKIKAFALMKL
jgi:hypothetical protein